MLCFNQQVIYLNYDKIAVIMTGMGADGAKGLIELKEKAMFGQFRIKSKLRRLWDAKGCYIRQIW